MSLLSLQGVCHRFVCYVKNYLNWDRSVRLLAGCVERETQICDQVSEDLGFVLERVGKRPSERPVDDARALSAYLLADFVQQIEQAQIIPGSLHLSLRPAVSMLDHGLSHINTHSRSCQSSNGWWSGHTKRSCIRSTSMSTSIPSWPPGPD